MSTGYTADVCNGKLTNFKAFTLRCAHALVDELKESDKDSPIPEFKPGTHHSDCLLEAQAQLARLKAMTKNESEAAAMAERKKLSEAYREYDQEKLVIKDRLLAMRVQVDAWQPPTSDHQGLKDFMIQQIDSTIEFDCTVGTPYLEKLIHKDGEVWRSEQVAECERDIENHTQEHAKEVARVAQRNKWVAELQKSLWGI